MFAGFTGLNLLSPGGRMFVGFTGLNLLVSFNSYQFAGLIRKSTEQLSLFYNTAIFLYMYILLTGI